MAAKGQRVLKVYVEVTDLPCIFVLQEQIPLPLDRAVFEGRSQPLGAHGHH